MFNKELKQRCLSDEPVTVEEAAKIINHLLTLFNLIDEDYSTVKDAIAFCARAHRLNDLPIRAVLVSKLRDNSIDLRCDRDV